jgi:hypothetical protein
MLPKIAVMSFSLSRMTSVKALMMSLAMWAALLAGSACTFYKDVPARSMAEATGGEGLERVFWKNVQSANWIEMERALASNYAGVTPDGTLDRSATIAQYRNWQLKDYAIGDLQTELNGSTIVVTYTVTLNGTLADGTSSPKPLSSGPQHMMTVWQQQKKGWVAIAHSSSQQSSSQHSSSQQ